MSSDDTEFDKLLKEARDWDARDRARHKGFASDDEGVGEPLAPRPRPPVVTIEELEKKEAADLRATREAPGIGTPARPSTTIKAVLKTAVKQAREQKQANARQGAERAKAKGGGWGWIVWLVVAYFVFKHYLH